MPAALALLAELQTDFMYCMLLLIYIDYSIVRIVKMLIA